MLLVWQLPQKSSSGREHIVVLSAYSSLASICALSNIRAIVSPTGLSSGRSRHRDLRSFARLIAQQSSTLDMEKKIDADSAL